VITPQRYSNCGAISWFDGRAAARVDPKGPIFMINKGECVDLVKGEYDGVNEAVKMKSGGEITQVWLYTAFGHPHTSCGCFEAVAFYIPEVDGIGVIHRGFPGTAPNGLSFSTLADSTAGGRQVDGFHGISIEYMRSPKFLQADGGWNRIVWLPETIKERVKDFIPKELVDKVPTEKEVTNMNELRAFLEKKNHPVVERWKAVPIEVAAEKPSEKEKVEVPTLAQMPMTISTVPVEAGYGVGGFRIILRNAKIHAKKIRIRSREK
jgi:acetyl-CoA decarbonylase/synthase complex subunit beta